MIGESGWDHFIVEAVLEKSNFCNLSLKFCTSLCCIIILLSIFIIVPECCPNVIHGGRKSVTGGTAEHGLLLLVCLGVGLVAGTAAVAALVVRLTKAAHIDYSTGDLER